MSCAKSVVDYYENVSIHRLTDACLPSKPERDTSVIIVFNRQACPDTDLQQPVGPMPFFSREGFVLGKKRNSAMPR